MKLIDLRSDTVTKPDKNIIEEALQAELGDDEYGEDPTVNNLQEKCAELLGFESGLFVSSGLMGNQISLLIHNSPGTEVITTSDSHIKNYEHGAASFLSRVQFREIDHEDGALNLDTIKSVYEKFDIMSADGSNSVDLKGGIVSFSYFENLFSPMITAQALVVNTGNTVGDKKGDLQSVYNGLPLRGGEIVNLKIQKNSDQNEDLEFTENKGNELYVASITNVLIDAGREAFTLNLVSREE